MISRFENSLWEKYRSFLNLAYEAGLTGYTARPGTNTNDHYVDIGVYRVFFDKNSSYRVLLSVHVKVKRRWFGSKWVELKHDDVGPWWQHINDLMCELNDKATAVLSARDLSRKLEIARAAGIPTSSVPGALSVPESPNNRGNMAYAD